MTLLRLMRRRLLRPFFIVCLLLPLAAAGALHAAQKARIEIPPVVRVGGAAFALGDIAAISGPEAVREALASLILSGEDGFVGREQVVRALEASELGGVRIELKMPETVRVERYAPDEAPGDGDAGETGPDETLSSMIKSLAAWGGEVEVSCAGAIPPGRLVSPASLVPGTPAATLRFRDGAGRERSLAVRLIWTQKVLFMARSVPKEQPLKAGDLVARGMRIAKPGVYATQLSEVVGRVSRKPLPQGKPVPLEFLSELAVVKKGKAVRVVVRRGELTVTAKGVLLDDGAPGDVVRVRRADDKKIVLEARVLDGDTVEVDVP